MDNDDNGVYFVRRSCSPLSLSKRFICCTMLLGIITSYKVCVAFDKQMQGHFDLGLVAVLDVDPELALSFTKNHDDILKGSMHSLENGLGTPIHPFFAYLLVDEIAEAGELEDVFFTNERRLVRFAREKIVAHFLNMHI